MCQRTASHHSSLCGVYWCVKAISYIPCRAHAVLRPLPCSDSAVFFVKVRVVTGKLVQHFNGSSFEICCYHS